MSDAEILKAMLKDSAIVQLQVEYSKNIVVLTEPQVQDSTAKIHNIPDEAIIIKIDSFSAPKDIFRGDQGECKTCRFRHN
jgi:hypothetical protein